MIRKIYTFVCLAAMSLMVLAVGYHVLAGSAHEPTVIEIDSGVTLTCPDDPLAGEVTLLPGPVSAWRVTLQTGELAPPPGDGYTFTEPRVEWESDGGTIQDDGERGALWTPPIESGLYTVTATFEREYRKKNAGPLGARPICHRYQATRRFLQPLRQTTQPGATISIAVPGHDKFLIGRYPDPKNGDDIARSASPNRIRNHPDVFSPPQYWYPVNEETQDLKISRSYTLGEFDLNRTYRLDWPFPGYIALDRNIVLKLESLADALRKGNIPVKKFELIYGYRSPYYNLSSIEKDGDATLKSPWSLHMYGKAADIIVDEDEDGRIDDLDGDGEITIADPKVIRRFVRKLDHAYRDAGNPLLGGNFCYVRHDFTEREPQTPYIHIDVRNHTREDGSLIQGDYLH